MIYVKQINYSDNDILKLKLTSPSVKLHRDDFYKECVMSVTKDIKVNVVDTCDGSIEKWSLYDLYELMYNKKGVRPYIVNIAFSNIRFDNEAGMDIMKMHIADMDAFSFRLKNTCISNNMEAYLGYTDGYCMRGGSFYYNTSLVFAKSNIARYICGLSSQGDACLVLSETDNCNMLEIALYKGSDKVISVLESRNALFFRTEPYSQQFVSLLNIFKSHTY